ncbi:hypothetical protein BS50DRAFT_7166 [Corynespora cassiicola Philippines]|uniref:Uncharacterized protein n=1 Tax=Corynespora cassiicola Philippines TaxID=1448308 RepID=A0A2T2P8V2_CORCC|nr:hypothetical protein BS50DRAFT_7166 [Corynespora cassiicola Philippines]
MCRSMEKTNQKPTDAKCFAMSAHWSTNFLRYLGTNNKISKHDSKLLKNTTAEESFSSLPRTCFGYKGPYRVANDVWLIVRQGKQRRRIFFLILPGLWITRPGFTQLIYTGRLDSGCLHFMTNVSDNPALASYQ